MKAKLCILILLFIGSIQMCAAEYYFKQISLEKGLSSRALISYTDYHNTVWIGTVYGLGRFDGYSLKTYTTNDGLPDGRIKQIIQDNQENIWILTNTNVALFQLSSDKFKSIQEVSDSNITVNYIYPTQNGVLLATEEGIYEYLPNQTIALKWKLNQIPSFHPNFIADWDKDTYICCDRSSGKVVLIHKKNGKQELLIDSRTVLMDIVVDSEKQIWLAVYDEGIRCYSSYGKLMDSYTCRNSALNNDAILCCAEYDSEIWIGTDGGGLNVLNPKTKKIRIIAHVPGDNNSLPSNSINHLQFDGNALWASTVRSGLVGIKTVHMKTYANAFWGSNNGPSNNTILSLHQDNAGTIWVGTDGGGLNSLDPITHRFKHFQNTYGAKVTSVTDYDQHNLLMSCYREGVFIFNKQTHAAHPFNIINDLLFKNSENKEIEFNVYKNRADDILILTNKLYSYNIKTRKAISINIPKPVYGLLIPIGKDEEFTYLNDMKRVYALEHKTNRLDVLLEHQTKSDTLIYAISRDRNGKLWMGTNVGLSSYDVSTKQYRTYDTSFFSQGNSVVCDYRGNVWLGSRKEKLLVAWSVKDQKYTIYSESDGVALNEYVDKARLVTANGDVYIGGVNGLLRISNKFQTDPEEKYEFLLAGIEVNGESIVDIPENFSTPWKSNLTFKIYPCNRDIFSHRFYRYNVVNESGQEEYQLESNDLNFSIRSFLPGRYTIFVSSSTKKGGWTPRTKLLSFSVTPPWYLSTCGIISILALLLVIVAGILFEVFKRKEYNLKLILKEQERKMNEKKIRFLINISHELRTPLTLLHAPIKRMLQSVSDTDPYYSSLNNMYIQTMRMKNIINMVLDLRRMEIRETKLVLESELLNEWIQKVIGYFLIEANNHNIKIHFLPDESVKEIQFDSHKCETILTNILINALKHSPDDSEIQVSTQFNPERNTVRISVADEGKGLKDVDVDKLFTRFYQGDNEQDSSGIGLSYAKALIELHGGGIGAQDNEDGKGCTFFFDLPLQYESNEIIASPKPYLNDFINCADEMPDEVGSDDERKPDAASYNCENCTLLLVDDNQDLTAFLKNNLENHFKRIFISSNGSEAYEMARTILPDIIISDVMMPQMDGYSLCKHLKQNLIVSHIPVILLTARNDEKSTLLGYKNGADGYLTKPFDLDLLLELVKSILQNKENVKRHYLKVGALPQPETTTFSNADEAFLLKLNKIINEHLNNPLLDVIFLCHEMAMSRSALYNKLKVITNMGVNDYIKKMRMEYAIQLMISTNITITEIADKVGFSTLKYFSATFKQYTGKTPSCYKKEFKQGT